MDNTWMKRIRVNWIAAQKKHTEIIALTIKTHAWYIAACVATLAFAIVMWWPAPNAASEPNTEPSENFFMSFISEHIGTFGNLIVDTDTVTLRGERDGRINFLLLGHGNKGHEAEHLTDSVMIASLDTRSKRAMVLTVPRDLIIPMDGLHASRNWHKINAVNAFAHRNNEIAVKNGETNVAPSGSIARDHIGSVFGIPLHYYVKVDFNFFKQLIDDIGGIEVDVERSFVDSRYPTDDYGYQTIAFESGVQRMNGDTALKYVRSRHGTNGENSDFARSARQQRVIIAFKDKATSFTTLLKPSFIKKTLDNLNENIETDLQFNEIIKLAELGISVPKDHIHSFSLNDMPGNFLSSSFANDGASILLPDTGNFSDIQKFMHGFFTMRHAISEQPTIAVLNGTLTPGLASFTAQQLELFGFETTAGNAPIVETSTLHTSETQVGTSEWLSYWFDIDTPETFDPETAYTKNKKPFEENVNVVVVLGPEHAKRFAAIMSNIEKYEHSRALELARRASEAENEESEEQTNTEALVITEETP